MAETESYRERQELELGAIKVYFGQMIHPEIP